MIAAVKHVSMMELNSINGDYLSYYMRLTLNVGYIEMRTPLIILVVSDEKSRSMMEF